MVSDKRTTNLASRKKIASCALKGVLHGVVADQELNDVEVCFLKFWIKKYHDDHPVLLNLVSNAIQDKVFTEEEIYELNEYIDEDTHFHRSILSQSEMMLNELIGILGGISADNIINEKEMQFLSQWFEDNATVCQVWPLSEIRDRAMDVLINKGSNQEAEQQLMDFIKRITSRRLTFMDFEHNLSTGFLIEDDDSIDLYRKCVCFAGEFLSGEYKILKFKTLKKGAIVSDTFNDEVDILVLGSLSIKDWLNSEESQKIRKALDFKETGKYLRIISEKKWRQLI